MQNSTCGWGPCFIPLITCLLVLASCASPESEVTAPPPVTTSSIATGTRPTQPLKHAPGRLVIVVKPGQSLGRIAEHYHVAKRAIIEANQLQPPYDLKAGSQLVIPEAAANIVTEKPKDKVNTSGSGSTKTAARAMKVKLPPTSEPEVIPLD